MCPDFLILSTAFRRGQDGVEKRRGGRELGVGIKSGGLRALLRQAGLADPGTMANFSSEHC